MIFVVFGERKEETIHLFQKLENRCSTKEIVSKISSKCFPSKTKQEVRDRTYLNRQNPN